ncbi:MAG: Fic family protein [Candidatus Peregrinibacteria bacterium]|nr:Fic family protein [Candidatus Peregrinibacteria bacterium]MDZ4244632.1 Fic family protein [Candidatus Gracilibacteria bacterium]
MTSDNLTINIPDPSWGSQLANIILDLEKLRSKNLHGELPPHIFFQLKDVFQILETLGSARIEGNNTTLAEYVEKIIEKKTKKDEGQREVLNLDEAIKFIEDNADEERPLSRAFILELHKIITKDLTPPPNGEGSRNPGNLRKHNVQIKKAQHTPPDYTVLPDYFDEFLKFINTAFPEQYQLLMVALAHHRFAYIHPFDNGNGRIGRLLNYALLIKLGFRVKNGRIINPSSVFYTDRDKYYDMLGKADSLKSADILEWAEYFLTGLKNEIEKIDSLLSREYTQEKILLPALNFALDRGNITEQEFSILKYLVLKKEIQMKSEELDEFGIKSSLQKSRIMAKLRDKNIIHPIKKGGRIYTISFINNYLLRGVIKSLTDEGFISDFLNKN